METGTITVDARPNVVCSHQPQAATYYMVMSWYSPAEKWRHWPDMWTARAYCETWVEKSLPRGHTHYVIYELKIPGIEK